MLVFFYGAITLSGQSFQISSNQQAKEENVPTTPHLTLPFDSRFSLPFAVFNRLY